MNWSIGGLRIGYIKITLIHNYVDDLELAAYCNEYDALGIIVYVGVNSYQNCTYYLLSR